MIKFLFLRRADRRVSAFLFLLFLVSVVLLHRVKVDFLCRNREQLVLAFYKRCHFGACLGTLVFAVRTVVLVHHLLGDAPTAKVEPAVAFHCQLHTTLMADCLAQVVVAVAAISRECRHSDTFAHLVEHCFCHCDIQGMQAFRHVRAPC